MSPESLHGIIVSPPVEVRLVGEIDSRFRLLTLLGLSFLVALLAPLEARCDTIYLKNGSKIEGKVVHEDDKTVTIEVPAHPRAAEAERRPPIRNTISRDYIDRVVRGETLLAYVPQEGRRPAKPRGFRVLFRTLPIPWLSRWDQLTYESSISGLVLLGVVTLGTLILLPALFLHAGSSVIGVTDPTYSRALLCIILLVIYSIGFAWLANALGLLDTLVIYEESPGHIGVVLPLYFFGQAVTYKWAYVSTWGKATGLVLIGLLVALITLAGFLVLLTIMAS